MKRTAEELFCKHLDELGLRYEREVKFHPIRQWRIDFVLPDHRIGIEVEGAIWVGGRHVRGAGYQADLNKYNHATMCGYRILRFSTSDVQKGAAKAFLAEWMGKPTFETTPAGRAALAAARGK